MSVQNVTLFMIGRHMWFAANQLNIYIVYIMPTVDRDMYLL